MLSNAKRNSINRLQRLVWCCLCLFNTYLLTAQVSPTVPATTAQHSKQVIGYITQWDAWKEVANLVPKGGYNQLNVDYSQYTILNFSFFGVAQDGSLHSGDFRNKSIYQVGAVQAPAPLLNTDIYSSWDLYLINGELETLYYISDGSYAYQQGYRNEGSGWKNVNTNETGSFPLNIHKQGGAPGILELAHQKGVKVLASVGGWSMCKHYPEVAADATKRAKFVADCVKLINMGFDGIDFDWEYPNDAGMNIEHYSAADYTNFAILLEQVRAAIGSSKLMTSCFSASTSKLQGFDWPRLSNTLNYLNMMTYDYNGGWSNKAGHNSPLYDYPGAEYSNYSIHATVQGLRQLGVNLSKVNIGAPFYGRGVITAAAATLNGTTVKRAETVQPDGPIQTSADYTNWAKDLWDGTPNYAIIQLSTGAGSGWTDYWDDNAKVPYKTKGNYFLSYDNERSVGEKAQYIKDNGLAGVIIWQVYGDMTNMTSSTVPKGKLIYCPNTTNPLVNKINAVFATGGPGNIPPTVSITAPANNASFIAPANITIQATAADADGTVSQVAFYNGSTLLGTDATSPYSYAWNNVGNGSYAITARATDNAGAVTTSGIINITVTGGNIPPTVSITAPANNASFTSPANITIQATAADADGTVSQVAFYNGSTLLGTDASSPYSYAWNNVANGTYTLTARATDNLGAVTTSSVVTITVSSGGGDCSGIPAWNATTPYNGGAQVVYNNKVYQAKWWTQGNQPDINTGDGKPWAYVRDCGGGGGNTAPTVSITAPANNASFTAPATVNIQATAADADGTVSQVAFYNGNTLLGTDASSPYSYSWTNVGAGSYTLTARATDNAGAVTTSAAIAITVTTTGGGVNCTGVPAYQPYPKIYNNGDLVVYNNVLYQSQSSNLYNVTPGTAEWWWKTMGTCGTGLTANGRTATGKAVGDESVEGAGLRISPNPVRNQLNLRTGESLVGATIRILDINGRQVIPVRAASYQVDVSALAPGIYTLVFMKKGKLITKQFVK
jgi:chitinase